jgi:hypothetical protein
MLKTPSARLAGVLKLPHLGLVEEWEAGLMASHAFHTLLFPWPAFAQGNLPERHEV